MEGIELKPGSTLEEVSALMATLGTMVNLEEGELYTLRKGRLHHVVPREEENGLRRIKVMEEAYDAAQEAARRLRRQLRGYRPDPALVISACVMHVLSGPQAEADAMFIGYLQRLFTRDDANLASEAGLPDSATHGQDRMARNVRPAPTAL